MKLGRLRRGEVGAALAAGALLALLLAARWFDGSPREPRAHAPSSGWDALPGVRWLIVAAVVAAFALALLQMACRAPALPSTLSMISTVLGAATVVALAVRLATAAATPRVGAYLGLAAAVALAGAAVASLRQEGGWQPDDGHPVETVALGPPERGAGS